jgi:trehalose 6-phosphate synthase
VKLSLRFLVPLILVLAALTLAAMPLVDQLTLRWFMKDLDMRASLIASTVEEPVQRLETDPDALRAYFARLILDERLFAVGYCAEGAVRPEGTPTLPASVLCTAPDEKPNASGRVVRDAHGPLLISTKPIRDVRGSRASVVVVQDMSFAERRNEETRRYLFYFFVALGILVSLITVVVAQLSWRGWVQGMRALLRGEGLLRPAGRTSVGELQPIADDLRALIRDLESEHRMRDDEQLAWTPNTLREILERELRGSDVIVVSNREPFIHVRDADGNIAIQRPASGLVTAIEPIVRACSGTWIAHGSGSADREVVDAHDRVAAPGEEPGYKLRRLWLTREEEQGYYYGFANEGLWPLCHVAHVRPTFRSSDWEQYERANRRFADAVVAESRTSDPVVLVQDYHLALVPRMIRERLPDATIITFWHIPWPNPEAFAICPWRDELLDGLLGSSILGFHTQFHCNNFLDTVDRQLEARIDRETFGVSYRGERTLIKRYPISVEWPPASALAAPSVDACRAIIRARHGLAAEHAIGIGVERLDYTKGLAERFRAVARFIEKSPQHRGKVTFVVLGAPSRTHIRRYRELIAELEAMADEINWRLGSEDWKPLKFLVGHHDAATVNAFMRMASVCIVSALHDGMNLVAKEYVAARDDGDGVLVLSEFAGAARELSDALIINPYDTEQFADAIRYALEMPEAERRSRMGRMRRTVDENNVYKWAANLLAALGEAPVGRAPRDPAAVALRA